MDSPLPVVLGALILGGAIYRVRTLGSDAFYFAARLTAFAFVAFAIGTVCFTRAYAVTFFDALARYDEMTLLYAPVACLSYMGYRYVVDREAAIALLRLAAVAVGGFLLGQGLMILDTAVHARFGVTWLNLFENVLFIGVFAVIAAVHVLLGPVLSAYNIAFIVHAVVTGSTWEWISVFSLLDFLNVHAAWLKWAILFASTGLGLADWIKTLSIADRF